MSAECQKASRSCNGLNNRGVEREERGERARGIADELIARGVRVVALTWVDNAGVTRVKTVPVRRFSHAAAWGVGMSPVFDVFLLDDSVTSSGHVGGPTGDLRLHPGFGQGERPGRSARLGLGAGRPVDQDGEAYPCCQRTFARTAVEPGPRARAEAADGVRGRVVPGCRRW